MKTFADDRWEKEVERFKPFLRLWKTEDESWIEKRREAWENAIQEDGDPVELAYRDFYIFGEEPPRCFIDEEGLEQDIPFDIAKRISLTPFASSDDLLQFWEILVERNPSGVSRNHEDFQFIGDYLDRFPERDKMVKLITETMFSSQFFELHIDHNKSPGKTRITMNPRDFVVGFSQLYTFYFEDNSHEWEYQNFSIDYFLMSVRYCEENDSLVASRQQKAIPKMYEFLLALDDNKLDHYRLKLKRELISAAEAEDSGKLLREALDFGYKSEALWRFDSGHSNYLQQHRIEPRVKLKKPNLPK